MIRDKFGRFIKGKNLNSDHWNQEVKNHIFKERKCKCGCGQFIIPKRHHAWKPAQFISGHNGRGANKHNYNPDLHIFETRICACGCGQKFVKPKSKKQKFIWGHNTFIRDKELCQSIVKKAWITRRKNGFIPTSPLYKIIKESDEYKYWRTAVFERDNYICQECKKQKGELEVHHKKSFSNLLKNFLQKYDQFSAYEDKETLARLAIKYKPFWDINNGLTIHKRCHKEKYHFGKYNRLDLCNKFIKP